MVSTRSLLIGVRRVLPAGLLSLLVLVGSVEGQQQPPTQQLPDSIQELLAEFQELDERFAELQSAALDANPQLVEWRDQIGEMIEAAMIGIDPEVENLMDRMGELEAEAMAAQESEDMEALQALMMEAQTIQGRVGQAQEQALESEPIQTEIEAFQAGVLDGMKEIDPDAEQILQRLEELAALLGG